MAGTTARTSLRLELPEGADGRFAAVLQLTSAVDPSLVIDAADLWVAPALVMARFGDAAEAELLLALRRGARVWPPLQRLLDEAKPSVLPLDDDEAIELLGGVGVELAGAGIDVLWPSELGVQAELRASLGSPAPASVTAAGFTMDALLEFRWEVAIGDEILTADELADPGRGQAPARSSPGSLGAGRSGAAGAAAPPAKAEGGRRAGRRAHGRADGRR